MKYFVLFLFLVFFFIVYSSCVAAGKSSLLEENEKNSNPYEDFLNL